ncbi:MAG: DUF5655 domain-containing protein, partial [Elusimicrobiota bacterium]|nr:DUF5655 domain-containing protein [Elusimicrobiota bacterium]
IIKKKLSEKIPNLQFNPQRYYISLRKKRNFAFIKVHKKKLAIVVLMDEEKIRARVRHYEITKLAEGVQKFYNGNCGRIEITDAKNIDEVISVLVEIQK